MSAFAERSPTILPKTGNSILIHVALIHTPGIETRRAWEVPADGSTMIGPASNPFASSKKDLP